ncbi:MAG: tRNA (adenosine(37)-N6)-threonylcarbamoyltransferase complex transferase subunit TsaD [Patescibacteria group bacterium]|nr:tRNA (adenosine(37)-N6)-threonylcarbamoyltransferase complex transferase subunit TsaD [Patescibacteria group bacterium]
MLILAIETSCDETAAAVLQTAGANIKLLSSEVASQIKLHAKTFGVVPEVAARAHIESIIPIITQSLKNAKVRLTEVDALAVTVGPGLAPSLLVGTDTAKALAFALRIPIIAVNHIEAHIYSPFLKTPRYKLPTTHLVFPAVSLVVSGGHTEIFLVKDWLAYKKLGRTLDDAAGECFDKTARLLGLPYPGGPAISKLARSGKPVIDFPRPLLKADNFNFSFSGLKTAVLYYLRDNSPLPPLTHSTSSGRKLRRNEGALWKANIAASVQAAIVDVLVKKTLAATKKYRAKTVLLGGGVAANHMLRIELENASRKSKINFLAAAPEYSTDNAAMIGLVGYLYARKRRFTPLPRMTARANWEI